MTGSVQIRTMSEFPRMIIPITHVERFSLNRGRAIGLYRLFWRDLKRVLAAKTTSQVLNLCHRDDHSAE